MPNAYLIGTLVAAALILLCFYIIWRYLSDNVLDPAGKAAAKRTRGILSRYALLHRHKTLHGLELPLEDGSSVFVENMLIGFFGILIVHTVGARGEFYGRTDEKEWVLVQDTRRVSFPNPLREQEKAMRAVRAVLSRARVYNVPMERVTLFASRSKKTTVYISFHNEEIILGGKLAAHLERAKFDNDAEVDIDKIAAALEPYRKKQG